MDSRPAEPLEPGESGPEPVPRGTCFGFEIVSRLPFRFLRGGTGEALEVHECPGIDAGPTDELVVEWRPRGRRRFHGRVYRTGADATYKLWTNDAGWFLVDPDGPAIGVSFDTPDAPRECRLWTTPMLLCMLHRSGDHPLHAAAVEIDGEAVLFGAPGGFGKTTLAAAFASAGARVVAEDVSCVRLGPEPTVIPGPAVLRTRKDLEGRLRGSATSLVAETDERRYLAVEETGDCSPLPLRAILLLRADDSGIRLEPLSGPAVLRDLWALSFHLPTPADRSRCFEGITRLAGATSLWNLHRPLRWDRVRETVEIITSSRLTAPARR